jgi:hypothetical protein
MKIRFGPYIIGVLVLGALIFLTWYHGRLLEGFTGSAHPFERFSDAQQMAACKTLSDQIVAYTAERATVDATKPENAERLSTLDSTLTQVEAMKKSYGC